MLHHATRGRDGADGGWAEKSKSYVDPPRTHSFALQVGSQRAVLKIPSNLIRPTTRTVAITPDVTAYTLVYYTSRNCSALRNPHYTGADRKAAVRPRTLLPPTALIWGAPLRRRRST